MLANIITISRLIALFLLVPPLLLEGFAYKIFALVVFTYIVFTDWLDGTIARKTGTVSKRGAFLDPLADKIVVTSVLIIYTIKGLFWIWPLLIFLIRDFAVNGIRSLAARKGTIMHASIWGKLKTTLQFILIYALIISDAGYGLEMTIMILTILAVLFSLLSLTHYLWTYAQTN